MQRIDPRAKGESVLAHHRPAAAVWDQGGIAYDEISFAESLAPEARAAFKRDIDAYHAKFAVPAGLHVRREYLVAIGRRR